MFIYRKKTLQMVRRVRLPKMASRIRLFLKKINRKFVIVLVPGDHKKLGMWIL